MHAVLTTHAAVNALLGTCPVLRGCYVRHMVQALLWKGGRQQRGFWCTCGDTARRVQEAPYLEGALVPGNHKRTFVVASA